MKCIVDAQLPRRLARHLNGSGWDAVHTLDLPAKNQTADGTISRLADEQGRIVITKDEDFARDHILSGSPKKLLYIKTGNIGNNELIALVEQHRSRLEVWFADHDWVELSQSNIVAH